MPNIGKIRELKALLDEGAITQEEFEVAKAKLLAEDEPSPSSDSDSVPPPVAPPSQPQVNSAGGSAFPAALFPLATGLGFFLVLYRLLITLYVLYFASMMSSCCCGLIPADEISGGFTGAWATAGTFYSTSDGDTFSQLIYFFAMTEVTYLAWIMIIGGMVGSSLFQRSSRNG